MDDSTDSKKLFSSAMAAVTEKMMQLDKKLDTAIAERDLAGHLDAVKRAADKVKSYTREEADTIIRRLRL